MMRDGCTSPANRNHGDATLAYPHRAGRLPETLTTLRADPRSTPMRRPVRRSPRSTLSKTEARPLWTCRQLAGYKLRNDMPATDYAMGVAKMANFPVITIPPHKGGGGIGHGSPFARTL